MSSNWNEEQKEHNTSKDMWSFPSRNEEAFLRASSLLGDITRSQEGRQNQTSSTAQNWTPNSSLREHSALYCQEEMPESDEEETQNWEPLLRPLETKDYVPWSNDIQSSSSSTTEDCETCTAYSDDTVCMLNYLRLYGSMVLQDQANQQSQISLSLELTGRTTANGGVDMTISFPSYGTIFPEPIRFVICSSRWTDSDVLLR